MREFKFRAWHKLNKRFEGCYTYGYTMDFINGQIYHMGMNVTDRFEVMQYTGLNDCKRTKEYPNGQPIYEGDIIKCGNSIGYIVYDADSFIIKWSENKDFWNNVLWVHLESVEVIGNIYENPKLLEVST